MNPAETPVNKTLILIDGHALAYRTFFALQRQDLRTRDGTPTWAVFGFIQILLQIIEQWRPHLLAVLFDRAAPTFRHEEFEAYKAHRKPPPDGLHPQIETIKEVVRAFGIPVYEKDGYEADDLIGTIARRVEQEGFQVLIVTGDRDTLQLVDDRVHVLLPGKGALDLIRYDPAAVLDKYGLRPDQIADFKGLSGDPSDNIPGVPGIGEKRATELLQQFDSLDNLLAHLDQLKTGKMRQSLEENVELARRCRWLATIDTEAPLDLDLEACHIKVPDLRQLTGILERLEFRSLLKRLSEVLGTFQAIGAGTASGVRRSLLSPAVRLLTSPTARAPASGEMDEALWFDFAGMEQARSLQLEPEIITREAQLQDLLAALSRADRFAIDTETTDLNVRKADLVGISLAFKGSGVRGQGSENEEAPSPDAVPFPDAGRRTPDAVRTYYIPVGHRPVLGNQLPRERVIAAFKPILEDPERSKVMQNAKFDLHILANEGVAVQGLADDSMIADYLIDPEKGHGLKEMALRYLNTTMVEIAELIGKGAKAIGMDQVEIARAASYAAADAAMTLELAGLLRPKLAEGFMLELYQQVELPLVQVLLDMERVGIAVDVPYLQSLSGRFSQRLQALEGEIHDLAGMPFNINSPRQLSAVLFEQLGLSKKGVKKTQSGWYSTDAAVLERLRSDHPVVAKLLEYRELAKLKSTYTEALVGLVDSRTGRVHTTFNQTVTATGRLSSSNPNLQNIPIRTEIGREIRRAFIPGSPDRVLLCADYSQIELRILAHLSEDPAFVEAFRSGQDIHARTASDLFGVPLEAVTPEMRAVAKTTNFGILYGQTQYGLARTLGIGQTEAQRFIQAFQQQYQGVYRYLLGTLNEARHNGYVATVTNRRRFIPDIQSPNRSVREFAERTAINAPVQGSASDIIKLAMVRLHGELKRRKLRSRMLLQVHDELVIEMPKDEGEAVMPLVKEIMENAYPLKVPLVVSLNVGPTWMEAK